LGRGWKIAGIGFGLLIAVIVVLFIAGSIIGGQNTSQQGSQPSSSENKSKPSDSANNKQNKGTASKEPSSTFGDGTHQVGTDVQPGTYRTRQGSSGCYWERLSALGGSESDVLASDQSDAPEIVTIEPTDKGFRSDSCGTWTQDLSAITQSKTSFEDGVYIVGTDIEPGRYRNSGSSGCYYEKLSGFSGDSSNDVIASGNTDRPAVIAIEPTDAGFKSARCGTWSKID
jgi:hypothetical protein